MTRAVDLLVQADWLSAHLEDPQVVVIDCRYALGEPDRGRQEYDQGHIPGAYYLSLDQHLAGPRQLHGGRHPLPDPHQLAVTLGGLGVSDTTLVVAYDDSRFAYAARLWWLLQYLGHGRVSLLEGGWAGWQGYPTTTAVPAPRPGLFTPQVQPQLVASREQVMSRAPTTVLVDSREASRYRGESEPIDPVAGHIPGALNYYWLESTTPQGGLLPLAAQRQRWEDITTAPEVIVYCGSGVTACVNLLALAQTGYQGGKLYPGSWSDWCSYPS